jgi:hypothetical protein
LQCGIRSTLMKLPFFFVCFGLAQQCCGQSAHIIGQVMDSEATPVGAMAGVTVLLKQDSIVIKGADSAKDGTFQFYKLPAGNYSLQLKMVGYRTRTLPPVQLAAGDTVKLVLNFPGPCQYTYRNGRLPVCEGGHNEGLLPIVYGLPSAKTIKKAHKREL